MDNPTGQADTSTQLVLAEVGRAEVSGTTALTANAMDATNLNKREMWIIVKNPLAEF
jgi:hypothetical protein